MKLGLQNGKGFCKGEDEISFSSLSLYSQTHDHTITRIRDSYKKIVYHHGITKYGLGFYPC